MCGAEDFIDGVSINCFSGDILGVLGTPPRSFRVRRFRLGRKRRRCLESASAVARLWFQLYCASNSSAMCGRMELKLCGYDEEVVGYATVQAARDLDVG
ncbi:UNVERIFIED_CONTAM: hypothetical protein Sradi_4363500 [Sesamum radiatum]|uniref:Uncharacterized protein n=1 Tax=Sesamum radiatum TaxID=300843 RepID=A0AAW2NPC7_SESRA